VPRHCSRPGCSEPAEATLIYNYSEQRAWIDPLTRDRDPHSYDLCRRHADRVRVMNGWELFDRRFVLSSAVA
jgi:hypothetical protein